MTLCETKEIRASVLSEICEWMNFLNIFLLERKENRNRNVQGKILNAKTY